MNIGKRMKNRRKELKLSADDVAERIGVSRSNVYRYEKGDIEKLPLEILGPLSEVLKTTPQYLMGWDRQRDIDDIYDKLTHPRQKKVYTYAEHQLEEQNNNQQTDDDILIAAHMDENLSEDEQQQVNDFIEKLKREQNQ